MNWRNQKMKNKQIVKLEKGKYVRIKGFVTMYAPSGNKKVCGQWIGGSSWIEKNPLIRIGRCKHKPKKVDWFKHTLGHRVICKGRIECEKCGAIIKFGKKEFKK